MPTKTSLLHAGTPTLAVVDPRGLGIRNVAYHRTSGGAEPVARIQRSFFDARGYQERHWDPRLWQRFQEDENRPSNGVKQWSMSGKPLLVRNVDSGWRVSLFSATEHPVQIWDGRRTTIRYVFDDLLRPVSTHERIAGSAERCVERFTYGAADATGNRRGVLIRHDHTGGTQTAGEYTLAGSPLEHTLRFLAAVEVPDWPEDVTERDAKLEAEAWTTHYRYSALAEPVLHTDARGNTQRSVRKVDGSLGQVWLALAGSGEHCLLRETAMDAEGATIRRIDGNGIERQWEFAPMDHRLKRASVRRGSDVLQDLSYAYDAVGNIVSIADAAQPATYFSGRKVEPVNTYSYDTLYRLIGATGRESLSPAAGPEVPAWQPEPGEAIVAFQQTYEYDDGGNLLSLRHTGAQSYTRRMAVADTSNRSMPLEDGQPPPDLVDGFDDNGNLRRLQPGRELAWNARNMLSRTTQVVRAQSADDDERYVYGGTGKRVRKLQTALVGGQSRQRDVRYLPGLEWRHDEVTGERLQVVCTEIDGGTVRTLHWENNTVPSGMENDTDRYAITDRLGSCTLELDEKASLVSHEWYHPYGSTAGCVARSRIEAGYKTVHYSGKERDDSGLHYYGFRYYASWLMRWITADPAGDVGGTNRFAMVGGNPTTHADASGLAPSEDGEQPDRGATMFDSIARETMITVLVMGVMLLATVFSEVMLPAGGSSALAHATLLFILGGVAAAGMIAGSAWRTPWVARFSLALAGVGFTAGPYVLALADGNAINEVVTNMFATTVYAFTNEAAQQLFSGIGNTLGFGDGRTPGALIAANALTGGVAYGLSAVGAYYADNRIVDYMLIQPAAAGALMAATTAIGLVYHNAGEAEITSGRQRMSPINGRNVLMRGALRIASQAVGDLLVTFGNQVFAIWSLSGPNAFHHARRFMERFLGNIANESRGWVADRLLYDAAEADADSALEDIRTQGGLASPGLLILSPLVSEGTPSSPGPRTRTQFTFSRSNSSLGSAPSRSSRVNLCRIL